jgi:hypothetical protein
MIRTTILAVLFLPIAIAPSASGRTDDDFLRGYVAAVVEREFGLKSEAVEVHRGIVTVRADISPADEERLRNVLLEVEGIRRVDVLRGATRRVGFMFFPGSSLFAPLLADPRWPRFSASYHYYIDDDELTHVAAPNFGELFPLVRYAPEYGGAWETGIQAGVFAIFDLASDSFDLINADYRVAVPLTYARSFYALMARVFHQSSHLGDEFLLRDEVDRVNLSYEGFDVLLSMDLPYGFRIYGGGGYLFRTEPNSLERGSVQSGLEFAGRELGWPIGVPVAAIDIQLNEEGNWRPNISPRVGLQFGEPLGFGRNLQFLLEYFDGKSPNGQFYDRTIRYIGFGAHLNF